MATMMEEYYDKDQEVPAKQCALCFRVTETQAYVLSLERPRLTRKWYFCSLSHLRQWSLPVRG